MKKVKNIPEFDRPRMEPQKGENITTEVLLRICPAPDCNISDIMEIVKDEDS